MMPTRFLRNILILFLIPASLACSLFTAAPTPSQADIEKEEQAIYALFVRDNQGPAVILQNTSTSIVEEDPKQMSDNIEGGLAGISNDTIDSFVERNAQPSQLSPDMQLGKDYILLRQEELAEISSQGNWHEVL